MFDFWYGMRAICIGFVYAYGSLDPICVLIFFGDEPQSVKGCPRAYWAVLIRSLSLSDSAIKVKPETLGNDPSPRMGL